MFKSLLYILGLTAVWSFLIFLGSTYFVGESEYEEQHVEPRSQASSTFSSEEISELIENISQEQNISQELFHYHTHPESFYQAVADKILSISSVLETSLFYSLFEHYPVHISVYKHAADTRGKMKNAQIHLYSADELPHEELVGVSLHELAHFFDIYVLKKSVFRDISYFFYDISWESTKILRSGQQQGDFVSGYAMTNKYEDFAESALYFMLHNKDFAFKAKESQILQAKYDFFTDLVFRDGQFVQTDFSQNTSVEPYYWDITKIDFSMKKLLQYLEK